MPREVEAAVASGARIIGLNNRDLRTLEVDPEMAVAAARARPGRPAGRRRVGRPRHAADRSLARPGLRCGAGRRGVRALGGPGGHGPVVRRRRSPAGRPGQRRAAPVREDLRGHRRGRCPRGGPRRRRCGRASTSSRARPARWRSPRPPTWPGSVRAAAPSATRPRIVRDHGRCDRPTNSRPSPRPSIPMRSSSTAPSRRPGSPAAGRAVWKVLHLPAEATRRRTARRGEIVSRGRAYLAAGATRLLLDTAGGPHPGGTGVSGGRGAGGGGRPRAARDAGRRPGRRRTWPGPCDRIAATGVDVASGVERPREPGERPTKDPFRVALFVKRARAARDDRPNLAFGPSPVHPGLLEADAAGRWGMERDFGGRYVPETLMAALEQLETAYDGPPPRPGVLGGAPRAARRRSPAARRRSTAPTAWPTPCASRRPGCAAPRRGSPSDRPRDPAPAPVPQARGPRPHRRPQDQQRARPVAADPAPRQDPGHRRDRRRPARRRDGHGLRPARPAVRRVHGRRGHRAPAAQRPADARPRRRGPGRHVGHGHAQGRRQRGDARLGHERRDDPLRAGLGDGPAPVPDDRPRPPAPDRRRGRGPARGRRGAAARTSRWPASAAARTPSGCSPGSSASRRSGSRSSRRPATGWRPAGTPRRSSAGRRASSTARAR